MSDPTTTEEWMVVARERGADADAMLPKRDDSIGPVYMAGYAVECALKAYLQSKGIPRPTAGRGGHHLRGLWKTAGFRLRDLKDGDGHKAFFLDRWTTDLRYQGPCRDLMPTSRERVEAAKKLVKWLNGQVKRARRRM